MQHQLAQMISARLPVKFCWVLLFVEFSLHQPHALSYLLFLMGKTYNVSGSSSFSLDICYLLSNYTFTYKGRIRFATRSEWSQISEVYITNIPFHQRRLRSTD